MIDFKLKCTIKRLAAGTHHFSKQVTMQLLKMESRNLRTASRQLRSYAPPFKNSWLRHWSVLLL